MTNPCLTRRHCTHPHAHTHSLSQALERTNCLVVGAGQTPTRGPHAHLLTCRLARFLLLFLSGFLSLSSLCLLLLLSPLFLSLLSSFSCHFSLLLLLSLFSPQNGPPIRFISAGRLGGGVRPKLTSPHLRRVTMTTCALSKKAGVGARERTLLRKNKGARQSSRKNVAEEK